MLMGYLWMNSVTTLLELKVTFPQNEALGVFIILGFDRKSFLELLILVKSSQPLFRISMLSHSPVHTTLCR